MVGTERNLPKVERVTGHAFLHKKHHLLAKQLSDELVKMKEEGLFKRYSEQTNFILPDLE